MGSVELSGPPDAEFRKQELVVGWGVQESERRQSVFPHTGAGRIPWAMLGPNLVRCITWLLDFAVLSFLAFLTSGTVHERACTV